MICANPTCGNEFAEDPKQPLKKYCSRRCRQKVSRRTYRRVHKDAPVTKVCANPECGGMFEGKTNSLYCCLKCRQRVKTMRETAKNRERMKAAPKIVKPKASPGIAPLRTPRITAARLREQEAIERVVAKALASGAQGPQDLMKFRRRTNYRAVKVG